MLQKQTLQQSFTMQSGELAYIPALVAVSECNITFGVFKRLQHNLIRVEKRLKRDFFTLAWKQLWELFSTTKLTLPPSACAKHYGKCSFGVVSCLYLSLSMNYTSQCARTASQLWEMYFFKCKVTNTELPDR